MKYQRMLQQLKLGIARSQFPYRSTRLGRQGRCGVISQKNNWCSSEICSIPKERLTAPSEADEERDAN